MYLIYDFADSEVRYISGVGSNLVAPYFSRYTRHFLLHLVSLRRTNWNLTYTVETQKKEVKCARKYLFQIIRLVIYWIFRGLVVPWINAPTGYLPCIEAGVTLIDLRRLATRGASEQWLEDCIFGSGIAPRYTIITQSSYIIAGR